MNIRFRDVIFCALVLAGFLFLGVKPGEAGVNLPWSTTFNCTDWSQGGSLNCDGMAPAPYEGTEVGFSSLCASPARADATDRFLADVTREIAELTPGPWLHLGGDESLSTSTEDYLDLVRRIAAAGAATGKTVIGWHEMGASTELPPGTIGQYWSFPVAKHRSVSTWRARMGKRCSI